MRIIIRVLLPVALLVVGTIDSAAELAAAHQPLVMAYGPIVAPAISTEPERT